MKGEGKLAVRELGAKSQEERDFRQFQCVRVINRRGGKKDFNSTVCIMNGHSLFGVFVRGNGKELNVFFGC